jgi:hypothetical protein
VPPYGAKAIPIPILQKGATISAFGPVQAPTPSAAASGRWGAPVAGVMSPTVEAALRLAGVRNRSKFRHGGCRSWWLLMTHSGRGPKKHDAVQQGVDSPNGNYGMLGRSDRLFRLDVSEFDYLRPFLDLICDELFEFRR